LADQRQGTANQCLGVADALGSPYEIKEIPHSSLAYLPNFILQSSLAGLQADHRDHIRPPWPDLVISGGRRTAPIARYIKRQSERPGGKRCFLAHIMHPGPAAGAGAFDLIAVPRHDRPHARLGEAANLYPVTGAPHRVTGDALAAAGGQWQDAFEKYSRPLVGLLLGGGTRRIVACSNAYARPINPGSLQAVPVNVTPNGCGSASKPAGKGGSEIGRASCRERVWLKV
jgi:mitochondrial fission protein ELM1